MKKLFSIIIFFLWTGAFAQYDFTVGLRAGSTAGITLKKITPSRNAFEGIIGFCGNCFSFTGLFEKQPEIPDVNGLSWFYGVGFHVSFYQDNINNRWFKNRYYPEESALGLGIDGIIGLEYKIPEIPLAFSLDFKPFFEITTDNNFWFWFDPGLGIKFAF